MALRPKQLRAIQEMPAARSWRDLARRVGVSENTLHRWLRDDPDFRAAVQERVSLALVELQHGLASVALQAVRTLEAAMDMSQKVPWGVRVKAAQVALESAIAVHGLAKETTEVDIGDDLARFLRDIAAGPGGPGAGGAEPAGDRLDPAG
jgi:transposase-like protein